MAAVQLLVVMTPNMALRGTELSSSPRAAYSVTIQLSKTVHSSVKETPASMRPAKMTGKLDDRTVKHAAEWMLQKTRQAARRPKRSARKPTTSAEEAAAA